MKLQHVVLSIVALALSASAAFAGGDTEFTYQGRLLDTGAPANGTFNVNFRLWDDPAVGNQVGATNTFNSLPILEGLFTVELDFGASAFDNNDRWLEITVDGVLLVPRQPITRAPYSIQTRGIVVDASENVGIGTGSPDYPLHVEDDNNAAAIYGNSNPINGSGVFGQSSGSFGHGVYGWATATTSAITYGVYGLSDSTRGRGVYGKATANTGLTFGGRFESNSTSGHGVFSLATASTGTTYGVYGQSNSTSGFGIYGFATAFTGTNYGVYGETRSSDGYAGYFEGRGNDAVYIENVGAGRGLHAVAPADTAVWGRTTTGFAGVHGQNASTSGRGVYGQASDTSGTNYGVYGASSSASGFDFYAGGAGTNYGASSSRRWKHNVEPISDPLRKLAQLRGVYYDWDEDHGGQHDVGMIAEEVGKVLPEIVNYEENGVDAIGMDYSKMTPLLVEAVNAMRAEKDAEIARQQVEIANLAKRLDRMEAMLKRLVEK